MENVTSKSTQIDGGKYPAIIDLNQARAKFTEALEVFQKENTTQVKEKFGEADQFYLSAKGYFELRNVIASKASLGPTLRALKTIEAMNKPKDAAAEKRLKRQGLVQAAYGAEIIGCMHYEERFSTPTLLFSGILIAVLVIIGSLWWEDYKMGTFNRHRR